MTMDPFSDYMNQMSGQAIGAMGTFTKIWTDLMTNMAVAGFSAQPGATPPDAARQIRGSMFRTMAESIDEAMRTPQFMDMIRQSMDSMLNFRRQLDSMMTQMHQAVQSTTREDIDTLMVTIRHMERRVLDRMEDMTERLDEMEDRLNQIAGNGHEERRSRRGSSRRESGVTD